MKPVPCKIIVNNWIGYCFTPKEFPSINQAVKYGKGFCGGVWWRIYDLDGNFIRAGRVMA